MGQKIKRKKGKEMNNLNNLDFNYISAKNFLCYGPEGIEIDLKKYGNIVLIRGENLDIIDNDEEEKIASNGIGKSSIPEMIVYCLYGKTIRYPKKIKADDVINNQTKTKLRLEVRWNKYRVVRTRSPDSLKMWQSDDGDWSQLGNKQWEEDHEISKGGGIPAVQELIHEKIGINYNTFVNLLVFADQPHCYFLEADGPTKREIIENLMSLHDYKEYCENAKNEKKEIKNTIEKVSLIYEQLLNQYKSLQDRIVSTNAEESKWKKQKQNELELLSNQLISKEKELTTGDHGKELAIYYDAQKEIEELNKLIPEKEERLNKIKDMNVKAKELCEDIKTNKHKITLEIQQVEANIQSLKKIITDNEKLLVIKDKKGQKCGFCYGIISEENFSEVIINAQNLIEESNLSIKKHTEDTNDKRKTHKELQDKIDKYNDNIIKIETNVKSDVKYLDSSRSRINNLSKIEKPETGTYEKVLEEKITELKKQIAAKTTEMSGLSPYVGLLQSTIEELNIKDQECKCKKNELNEIENAIPYIEFWINGYSPKGIPKSAICNILPALNSRISHWMQFLIDGKISLKFDGELNETIERSPPDGDPYVYYILSGGERRRLNLAVSQAFAYIMMLSSGISPSVVFLDEVTTNIDPIGVSGVYNMIIELAKEKQVFITTHDQELLTMLGENEVLFLRKKDGFTKIISQ
jgi:DNA repair exonuclease SbcCD ATPase subunit